MKTVEEGKSGDSPADNKESKKSQTPSAKKKSFIKKLDSEAGKLLQTLSDRANKKSYGRKIRDVEILALGLSLIQTDHITDLQGRSLSEKDRLAMAHEEYQKTNGKITLDQFIGKLLRSEVSAPREESSGSVIC